MSESFKYNIVSRKANIVKDFQNKIIDYWEVHGRKDLPWRLTTNPWKILLAEILLRKTTSEQVASVYNVLAEKQVEDIYFMNIDELEVVIKKLGMSKIKSFQIKKIAELIYLNHNGDLEILRDKNFIKELPGVGNYIYNTVLCFAFGYSVPALDTNMIRILKRFFNYKSEYSRARQDKYLWDFAAKLVPSSSPREFNWGILDLGAQVCKSNLPQCNHCILADMCHYNLKNK